MIEGTGFLIGLSLLIWIIANAVEYGQWDKVLHADPKLVILLVGCTILSSLLNGATFWITAQPIAALRFWDMQWHNMAGNMLNYAPIRLGAIARIMYHLRVDRLSLLQITAWFAMIMYIFVLGVGSCVLATLIRPQIDLIWASLVVGQMVLGGVLTRVLVGHPLIVSHGRGIDRMLREHRPLWGAMILRLADIAAFTGRMLAALWILEIDLPGSDVVILALVALVAQLIPFGRLGFREFCVAIAATRLSSVGAEVAQNVSWEQLALIESMGEAVIFIPGGAVALLWYRKRWKQSAARQPDEAS